MVAAVTMALSFFIGDRPLSAKYFGDTVNYAVSYNSCDILTFKLDYKGEWIWELLMFACVKAGLSVNDWFTIVMFLYVGTAAIAVCIYMPRSPWVGFLFVLASMSFFTYGVNGMRNGLACHVFLIALAFLLKGDYTIGTLLAFICFEIHHSCMLPLAAMLVALSTWKITNILKYAIWFWTASIAISLVVGTQITDFFASLGFDDRMSSYTEGDADMSGFSHAGFRWDFLLYSAMPIVMCWWVGVRQKLSDNWFTVIGVIYCLCNAFWIMVIRAQFSNRFAYLSWFIYPVVIAYPLLNIHAWSNQNKAIGTILLAYIGFTLFMDIIYW